MNIHHLELFYYVAKHRGIAAAARKMPYGIQQPAISVQLIQLEESLGTTLFRRQPFELTKAGQSLFAFVEPFFSRADDVAAQLRGETECRLRIGASQVILRDYLPRVLSAVRKKVPKLQVILREDYPHELLQAIEEDEIDIAITCVEPRPPVGFRKIVFARLQPCLLVPDGSRPPNPQTLLPRNPTQDALIALPPVEPLCRVFQRELKRRRIEWKPTIEVSSLELIAAYVREGFGIGLSFSLPGAPPVGVRVVPLDDFPRVIVAAVWRKVLSPPGKILIQLLSAHAALRTA
jgi:DNA-binding transcriptional LysR family regulator